MSTTTSLEQAQQHAEATRASLMLAHGNATSVESLLIYPLIAQAADLDIKIKALQAARVADQGWQG